MIIIVKLQTPGIAEEFERQRSELEQTTGEPMSNELFVAYMLDIRRQAMTMQTVQVDQSQFNKLKKGKKNGNKDQGN